MSNKRVTPELVVEEWSHHGITFEDPPMLEQNFLPTLGAWYYSKLPALNVKGLNWKTADFAQPTAAFHSTSVEQGAQIVKDGGLKTGVAASDGAPGIYCENKKRKSNVLIYGTHTLHHNHPTSATCAVFELCVDRAAKHGERRVVKGQWVQQEHNVFIVGVYTHLFPIAKLNTDGYYGWYRIHCSVFRTLQNLQVDEDGEPLTAEATARRELEIDNDI